MRKSERQQRIAAIAKEDGVTPARVEAGINEVEGLFGMVAADSEIPGDSVPRITSCPLCGGSVAFAPISFGSDIPRIQFTSHQTWASCRTVWKQHVIDFYTKAAKVHGTTLSEWQRVMLDLRAAPYAVILECTGCGKGFDPRR